MTRTRWTGVQVRSEQGEVKGPKSEVDAQSMQHARHEVEGWTQKLSGQGNSKKQSNAEQSKTILSLRSRGTQE